MVATRFERQTIKICVNDASTDGSETVKALVYGEWAIHHGYKVTHVPTGLSLGLYFDRLKHAKRFVLGLDSIGLPPLGGTFGKDLSGSWDWDQRRELRAKTLALKAECEAAR